MASKIFLDANFLLDLALRRDGYLAAREIMKLGIDGKAEFFTSPSVLHITSYFSAQHFSVRETRQILLTLLNDIKIIEADHDTVVNAISNTDWNDMEDAIQYYTALYWNLDYFLSSDKKIKKSAIPQLPVFSATEMLRMLSQGKK